MNDQERYRDLAERVLGRSGNGNEVSLTLDDAFAAQLTDAGASALGSGGDEVVAWSQWRLATEPWEALLLAFGRGERKELQLRIEREDFRKREDAMRRGTSWRTYGF